MFNKLKALVRRETKQVICPMCLNLVEVNTVRTDQKCSETLDNEFGQSVPCDYEFPLRYILAYGTAKTVPIQVFGWTMHGKTVFLDVLRLMLRGMGKVWPNYGYESFTKHDLEKEREVATDLRSGKMPPATQVIDRSHNLIYVMHARNMLRWGSKSLVIMDHAGERFGIDKFKLEVHEIPFLRHKDTTTLMFISIPRMLGMPGSAKEKEALKEKSTTNGKQSTRRRTEGELMDQLANIYIEAMVKNERLAQDSSLTQMITKGIKQIGQSVWATPTRKVVVVLTMADKIVYKLPERLREYLATDNWWDRLYVSEREAMTDQQIEHYLQEMEEISGIIRTWLLDDVEIGAELGGAILVNLLESNNILARYCMISATGHDEVLEHHAGTEITPKRVLDPLFWVLEMQDAKRLAR